MNSDRELVVVLCDSYIEAGQSYYIFKDWLERHESWTIAMCHDCDNGLLTNDGFAYIFIDARMVNLFVDVTDSIVYVQEFFDEIMTDEYNEREVYEEWKHQRNWPYARL